MLYNYLLGVPVVFMGYLLPGVVSSIIHPLRVRETGKYCNPLFLRRIRILEERELFKAEKGQKGMTRGGFEPPQTNVYWETHL